MFSLSVVEGWDYKTPDVNPENLISHDPKRAELSLKKARKMAKLKGVTLRTTFPSLYGKQSRIINSNVKLKNCVNLYTAPFVLPDQIMLGCSGVSTSFGSMKDRSIEDIWNGPDSEFVDNVNYFSHIF